MDNMTQSTRAGLQYLQTGANKRALEELCNNRDDAYTRARAAYEKSEEDKFHDTYSYLNRTLPVNTDYTLKKQATKKLLDISKAKLNEIDAELRHTFEELEREGKIHNTSVEKIKEEQENYRARLDLLTVTNPGVIEQFNAREEEVRTSFCLTCGSHNADRFCV